MRVLIATDGSECSQEALKSVAKRLWHEQTEFLVVHVIEPVAAEYAGMYMTYTPMFGQVMTDRFKDAETLLAKQIKYLKEEIPQFKIEGVVLEGPIRYCLVEKAKDWQADFVVVGSHGRKGLSKLLLGSVAEAVVSSAPCSVEVIRKAQLETRKKMEKNKTNLTGSKK